MPAGPGALHLVWLAALSTLPACSPRGAAGSRSPEATCEASREPEACAAAAELYFDGKNAHVLDHARSFRYASAACEGGHAFGCALAGYHHQDGLGTAWAPDRAIAAYEKACAGGAGVGCYNLASIYFGGHGVVADEPRALAYKAKAKAAWQAACDGSGPRWCTNVAYLLREEDAAGSRERCLELDQRSCDHGTMVGCTEAVRDRFALGRISGAAMVAELERLCGAGEPTACTAAGIALVGGGEAVAGGGDAVATDPKRGVALIVRGCEIGDRQACALAGAEHATGAVVDKDEAAADRYMTSACDRAHGAACMWIARRRAAGNELAVAAAYATRACQMGEREACTALSWVYFEGRGVARDDAAGERWAMESCRMGDPPGCGVLIERGRELPVPPSLGARMYSEACAAGMARACERAGAGGATAPPP